MRNKILVLVFFCLITNCSSDDHSKVKILPIFFDSNSFTLDNIASDLVIIPLDFGEITVSTDLFRIQSSE
jgi:hypothetical protein